MKTRQDIIAACLTLRTEIQQIFTDAQHWNSTVRKPEEALVNPDPHGEMATILQGYERGLSKELLCIHIAGPDKISAVRSLEEADQRIAEFNAWVFTMRAQQPDLPDMEATIAPWPYAPESHAQDLAQQPTKA